MEGCFLLSRSFLFKVKDALLMCPQHIGRKRFAFLGSVTTFPSPHNLIISYNFNYRIGGKPVDMFRL